MAISVGNIGNNLMRDAEKERQRQEREMMRRSMQSQMYPQQTAQNTAMQEQQKATDTAAQQKQTALPTNIQQGQTVPLLAKAPITQLKTQPLINSPQQAELLRKQLQEAGAIRTYLDQATPTPTATPAQQQIIAAEQQQNDMGAQLAMQEQKGQQEQAMIQQRIQQAMAAENQRHQQALANIQQMGAY